MNELKKPEEFASLIPNNEEDFSPPPPPPGSAEAPRVTPEPVESVPGPAAERTPSMPRESTESDTVFERKGEPSPVEQESRRENLVRRTEEHAERRGITGTEEVTLTDTEKILTSSDKKLIFGFTSLAAVISTMMTITTGALLSVSLLTFAILSPLCFFAGGVVGYIGGRDLILSKRKMAKKKRLGIK